MIKGSIQEEDITIINKYAPNIGALQYVRQMLTSMKREINNNTIIVGDFNIPLTPMDRYFDHYVVSFFVSFHSLCFKVYFIGYEYCYSCFLLVSIWVKYLFPALHFQSVCVSTFVVGLLQTAYIGVLFLYPFSQSLSFGWGIQPIYV